MTKAPALSDLQAAIVDYCTTPGSGGYGRPLEDVAAELSSPGQTFTADQIRGWMKKAEKPQQTPDPLPREHDDERRAALTEEMYAEAAETVPGAAAILGVGRFAKQTEEESDLSPEEAATIVARLLDFLVPEVTASRWEVASTSIYVPAGHTYQQWGPAYRRGRGAGEPLAMASALSVWDQAGHLVALYPRTRARRGPRTHKSGVTVGVYQCRLARCVDLHAISQRVLQVAMEFRPDRHDAMSHKELAAIVGRTKQALSHQMGLIADKVLVATGGRAGFRRRRNVRSGRKGKRACTM